MKTTDNSAPLPTHHDSVVAKPKRKRRRESASDSANGAWAEGHSDPAVLLHALNALKCGDYAVRLPMDWTGVAGKVADTFNEVVASNERTAQELAQLHQAVGDTRVLLNALTALKYGDFSVRLPLDWVGIAGKTADTFNEVVTLNQRMARELVRLRQSVGREGLINQQASLGEVEGAWAESVELINDLIADLVQPTSEMARVIGAVAQGNLSQTMAIEIEGRSLQGEFLRTARTVNTMVNQLSSFASEVTRVAREVGAEGKLGGQALNSNVNQLAATLTTQLRAIS